MPEKTKSVLPWTPLFLLLLAVGLARPDTLCAQSTLDSFSDQVAAGIAKEKKSSVFPKVLVVDFHDPASGIDALSAYLADQLSASLENKLPSGTIISRRKLVDFLASHRLSSLDLQSVFIAYWAADNIGANEILYGEMSPSDSAVGLNLKLLRIGTTKEAANWQVALSITEEILACKGKALDPLEARDALKLALHCNSLASSKAFIKSGGTLPKMIHWPNPPYSEEARKKKLSAKRLHDTFIDDLGNIILVIPHRPLQPEFDDIALQTMKSWKSQPATKDGKPTAVCTVFEVNWRLY